MGLKDKIAHPERLRAWAGSLPVAFQYTAGVAGQRFFETLRARGTFAVTHCPECGTTYLPPRVYCRDCFIDLSERWGEVAPRGVIHSYTLVSRDRDGRPLTPPALVGFVQIDGTQGGLVVPLAVDPGRVRIGQAVEAVLRPLRRRRGTIQDILHFR